MLWPLACASKSEQAFDWRFDGPRRGRAETGLVVVSGVEVDRDMPSRRPIRRLVFLPIHAGTASCTGSMFRHAHAWHLHLRSLCIATGRGANREHLVVNVHRPGLLEYQRCFEMFAGGQRSFQANEHDVKCIGPELNGRARPDFDAPSTLMRRRGRWSGRRAPRPGRAAHRGLASQFRVRRNHPARRQQGHGGSVAICSPAFGSAAPRRT
jgi:hypothetical protein